MEQKNEFSKRYQDMESRYKTLEQQLNSFKEAQPKPPTETDALLADLKKVAQDIDDEQAQVKTLLLAIHSFIGGVAEKQQAAAPAEEKPPLFAPGQEPAEEEGTQQSEPQRHGMLGGMLGGMMGGGMMGGGMFGGYYGGGFGRAMEMGMAMNLGANLVGSIFRI